MFRWLGLLSLGQWTTDGAAPVLTFAPSGGGIVMMVHARRRHLRDKIKDVI